MVELPIDSLLHCPHCKEPCLHHDRVEIFERHEDESAGLHVTVHGVARQGYGSELATPQRLAPVMHVDASMQGNPSSRRQGIRIELWCESCRNRTALLIEQHKGGTFVKVAKV